MNEHTTMQSSALGRTVLVFEEVIISGYLHGITPTEGIKVKHTQSLARILPIIGHNLETVQDRR